MTVPATAKSTPGPFFHEPATIHRIGHACPEVEFIPRLAFRVRISATDFL
jgi:hypothetical protein